MEAFLVSVTTVAVAEMGDRTQFLSLVLAAHYRRPWPILAGVLVATLANHALAGLIGVWFGRFLSPPVLDGAVAAGTTCGMLLANAPAVFLGNAFATSLPLKAIHYGASALFAVLGIVFVLRASMH